MVFFLSLCVRCTCTSDLSIFYIFFTLTLLALLPLVFMGGATLFNFAAALTWGIFVGTYSSIYVAAALLIYMPPLRRVESDK